MIKLWKRFRVYEDPRIGPDGYYVFPESNVWFNENISDLRIGVMKEEHGDFKTVKGKVKEAPWLFYVSYFGNSIITKYFITKQGAMNRAKKTMEKINTRDDLEKLPAFRSSVIL